MTPDLPADPIALFLDRLAAARVAEPHDATACVLATADSEGRPAARFVLLKGVDARGFSFYTNYESRKAEQLAANPYAALCFYWPTLGEQVRIEGTTARVSDAESDAYFATRPRGSQIGAWASAQSRPIGSREELETTIRELGRRFGESTIHRPPFWGGYLISPHRVEFWKQGESRLHDRHVYLWSAGEWTISCLQP